VNHVAGDSVPALCVAREREDEALAAAFLARRAVAGDLLGDATLFVCFALGGAAGTGEFVEVDHGEILRFERRHRAGR
jgi:hypothetical protein